MACNNCGSCCSYVALDIRPESVPWMELHGIALSDDGKGGKQLVIPAECAWRDEESRRCTDYEHRPEICREYLCDEARGSVDITREALEERKAQLLADYNAIGGALQDCDHWLAVIEKADEADE